jgi:hypothetical protein
VSRYIAWENRFSLHERLKVDLRRTASWSRLQARVRCFYVSGVRMSSDGIFLFIFSVRQGAREWCASGRIPFESSVTKTQAQTEIIWAGAYADRHDAASIDWLPSFPGSVCRKYHSVPWAHNDAYSSILDVIHTREGLRKTDTHAQSDCPARSCLVNSSESSHAICVIEFGSRSESLVL